MKILSKERGFRLIRGVFRAAPDARPALEGISREYETASEHARISSVVFMHRGIA